MAQLLDGPGGIASDDLNATIRDWPAGTPTPEHVNEERDVLVAVLRGSVVVEVDGVAHPRDAGEAILVERGTRRRLGPAPTACAC